MKIVIFMFFHHMAFFSRLLCFSNLKACWFRRSVLSTSSSIFSPRSSTFSMFSTMTWRTPSTSFATRCTRSAVYSLLGPAPDEEAASAARASICCCAEKCAMSCCSVGEKSSLTPYARTCAP